jgi:hypothetical protein
MPLVLDDASIEAVARRVVELLRSDIPAAGELVDAATIARRFSISRDYIYAHAEALGAVKLGTGPKARLRFDPAIVAERLGTPAAPTSARKLPRRRTRRSGALLPIREGRSS